MGRKAQLFIAALHTLDTLLSYDFLRERVSQLGFLRAAWFMAGMLFCWLKVLLSDISLSLVIPDFPFNDDPRDVSTSTLADGTVLEYRDGKWM
jgi:hypothetical protein